MTTLAQSLSRSTQLTIIGVVGFAAALAAASQVAIPLPGTPVPITLTPLVVVLAGMWLGPVAGAASMVLYLAAGAAGLPVFAPMGAPGIARFVGPTGGYLIAYPAAAYVAGVLSRRAETLVARIVHFQPSDWRSTAKTYPRVKSSSVKAAGNRINVTRKTAPPHAAPLPGPARSQPSAMSSSVGSPIASAPMRNP